MRVKFKSHIKCSAKQPSKESEGVERGWKSLSSAWGGFGNVFLCMKHWSIFFRAVSGHACYSQHVLRVHGCGEPHIASRAKQRSVETQHCLWNVQCALRKLKNVICEVSFSSDSNENDETVLEICYANYENLNWICTRLIEFACPRAFVVKQCPLFVWRNNRITGLLIINICCPLLSGHDALYSANYFCCAKSCYWFVK